MYGHPEALSEANSVPFFEHPLLEWYHQSQTPSVGCLKREIREIVECIHANMFEPGLNVKTVRKKCRIRDNNISSRFRLALGIGIKGYIDSHRMAAAQILLQQTTLAVFDIAMMVGYSHVETFYQVFHRHFACTPGEYRRQSFSSVD